MSATLEKWTAAQELDTQLTARGSPSEALSIIRRAPLFDPDLILQLGHVARRQHSRASSSYWDITEQIALAAADRGKWDFLRDLLWEICRKFPKSCRRDMLNARIAEAKCRWDDALSMYTKVVESNPLRCIAYKRQIAVLKSQFRTQEAIALLNYYLSIFSRDVEAWAELCALCLSRGRLEHALFAANEVVIHSPLDHAAHTLVADVYMTIGGADNVLNARRHYGTSLHCKQKKNLRALYGMWLASATLSKSSGWQPRSVDTGYRAASAQSNNQARTENSQALDWSENAIQSTYSSFLTMSDCSNSATSSAVCGRFGVAALKGDRV